jgi:DNA-binding FrmR family transcriptional regulator
MAAMDKKVKSRAVRRLKIIEGQVRGLQRLVEQDTYCIDVIHQSLAVKEALSSFENLMLENHLATHVIEQMKKGKDKKAIQEILSVYKLSWQK